MEFYQRLLIILIPMTVVLVLIRVIWYVRGKKSKDTIADETEDAVETEVVKDRKILKFPLYSRTGPIFLLCLCLFLTVYLLVFQLDDWPYLIILYIFFGLPSLIIFICWSLWKVEIFKDGFLYRDFVGKKREYKFKDLEYRMHPKGLKWYFYKDGKKVFCMPYYIENGNSLDKAYRKWISKNKKT